jgi:hypothetical protein
VSGLFVSAMTYCALGLLAVMYSHQIATAMNRFSVRFYEVFPILRKVPGARLAGTPQNYKSALYFFRILGTLMMASGIAFLGLVMLER